MSGKTKRYSVDEIAAALEESYGILSEAARILHCSRQTIYNHLKKSKKLQNAYDDASWALVDLAESKLLENIRLGKETSIIFCLKTKGKYRGYGPEYNYKINFDKLTEEQMLRIEKGENPVDVIMSEYTW